MILKKSKNYNKLELCSKLCNVFSTAGNLVEEASSIDESEVVSVCYLIFNFLLKSLGCFSKLSKEFKDEVISKIDNTINYDLVEQQMQKLIELLTPESQECQNSHTSQFLLGFLLETTNKLMENPRIDQLSFLKIRLLLDEIATHQIKAVIGSDKFIKVSVGFFVALAVIFL